MSARRCAYPGCRKQAWHNSNMCLRPHKPDPEFQPTTLTECQASMFDGECVSRECPVRSPGGIGGLVDLGCPLPWDRNRESEYE